MEDNKKQLFLDAMDNVVNKRKDKREKDYFSKKVMPDKSQNLAKGALDDDLLSVKSSGKADITPERIKVGKTDKLDLLGEKQDIIKADDHMKKVKDFQMKGRLKETMKGAIKRGDTDMISKLKMIGKGLSKGARTGLKAFPLIGGIMAAVSSGDASAAIPILGDADNLGPAPGSLERKLEDGTITPEERMLLEEQMKKMRGF